MVVPEPLVVEPSGPLRGVVGVPGDKSISHRCLLLGALAEGTTRATGWLDSEDIAATRAAVEALGAAVEVDAAGVLCVTGARWHDASRVIACGNSGTTARLLLGALAPRAGATLTGDASLVRRPMGRVLRPLAHMGARFEGGGTLPVRVLPSRLQGADLLAEVASAQVKSAVLLAGLAAEGPTSWTESVPTRDHTERMLAAMGAELTQHHGKVCLRPGRLAAIEVVVPGDLSSAAFWLVAGTLVAGSDLLLPGVGINPTRTGILDALARMGADIEIAPTSSFEPTATLRVRSARLRGTVLSGAEIPRLVDELPVLAVAAAFAEGETVIADAAELRVKECDRIAATVAGLRALGFDADERPDGMVIAGGGPRRPPTGIVATRGDHRIAMAFAIAGLRVGAHVSETASIATSYPTFLTTLKETSRA